MSENKYPTLDDLWKDLSSHAEESGDPMVERDKWSFYTGAAAMNNLMRTALALENDTLAAALLGGIQEELHLFFCESCRLKKELVPHNERE